ncbi:MAG: glycosyltransferase family 2 protein [Holosporaceae bacterium]|jgi:glycosyltransferase involved in cell wall biosynthesis|nr:glycosyltransferase family 2 protein [Holosporaceae bacterium]
MKKLIFAIIVFCLSEIALCAKPEFDVLIPVYKNCKFNADLIKSLQSAIIQIKDKYDTHVFFCIDDARDYAEQEKESIESSLGAVDKLAFEKHISENGENKGAGYTRYRLLEEVAKRKPKYFCFIDADDFIHPSCFDISLTFMEEKSDFYILTAEFTAHWFDKFDMAIVASEFETAATREDYKLLAARTEESLPTYDYYEIDPNGRRVFYDPPYPLYYPAVFFKFDDARLTDCIKKILRDLDKEEDIDASMQDLAYYYRRARGEVCCLAPAKSSAPPLYFYRQHRNSIVHRDMKTALLPENITIETLERLRELAQEDYFIRALIKSNIESELTAIKDDERFSEYRGFIDSLLKKISDKRAALQKERDERQRAITTRSIPE